MEKNNANTGFMIRGNYSMEQIKNETTDSFANDILTKKLDTATGTGKAKITDTTDIGALRKALGSAMSRVTELFPKARNRTPVVKSYLKFAQNLLIRVKATPEELQNSINELNSIADKEDKKRDDQRKKAEQRAEQEAKDYEKTLANVSNLNATTIEQLAKKPPVYNYDTHTTENKFRPSWAEYNEQKEKWNLNPNKLANEITSIHLIKRLEEDGKDNGLVVYQDDAGNWEKHSPKTLNNFIEDCLKYPTDPLLKNKIKPEKYAQDLEKASDVKNTLTLLDGKIYGINPQTTFNYPSAHIVHFKNFDFDIDKWQIVGFSPEHYFLYSKDYDLNKDGAQLGWDLLNSSAGQNLIDALAPTTTEWLTKSLGAEDEKETLIAFLECVGLSLLNSYEIPMWVFIRSNGGHGKSKLFNYLKSLFGIGATSGISIYQMTQGQAFDASELRYKEANLVSDEKASYVSDEVIGLLKSIGGGDGRNFSQKNTTTADFTNHAQLWFNMNDFPRFQSYDASIARRTCLFRWHYVKKYIHFNRDTLPELKKERGEFALKCLYYAKIAIERDPINYPFMGVPIQLTRSKTMLQDYKNWADTNDYFNAFIEEECAVGKDYRISCKRLLDAFNDFIADRDGKGDFKLPKFTARLQSKEIYRSPNRSYWYDARNERKSGVNVFEGITLKYIADSIDKVKQEAKDFDREQKEKGKRKLQAMYK